MWFSTQQALADRSRATEIPKATFDAATLYLGPLSQQLVTELGYPQKDKAKLETRLQKLQTKVTPPCWPTLALGHRTQNSP